MRLRNAALDLLTATGTEEAIQTSRFHHFRGASSMTDAIAALLVLLSSRYRADARDEALDEILRRFGRDDAAGPRQMVRRAGAFEPAPIRWRRFEADCSITQNSPSRIRTASRALIGSFAMAQPDRDSTGPTARGIEFFAEQALEDRRLQSASGRAAYLVPLKAGRRWKKAVKSRAKKPPFESLASVGILSTDSL